MVRWFYGTKLKWVTVAHFRARGDPSDPSKKERVRYCRAILWALQVWPNQTKKHRYIYRPTAAHDGLVLAQSGHFVNLVRHFVRRNSTKSSHTEVTTVCDWSVTTSVTAYLPPLRTEVMVHQPRGGGWFWEYLKVAAVLWRVTCDWYFSSRD